MEQTSIFDYIYETKKIRKPIRLIELFAGYGSQNLALKYLGVDYNHYKICEWATKSIQAYNDMHIKDYKNYSNGMSKDDVIEYLFKKGISLDYNEPMTLEQIKRKDESWIRNVYNNIIATNNLVNIQQVHANDLEIVDTDKYEYIMVYSYPCQDLSISGKMAGMSKGSGTRSGMLWEVERILDELHDRGGNLPQILLMENVPQVIGQKFIKDFQKWELKLRQLGYSNFVEILNAKNYGIPQNRERCFMISILGEYNYKFPLPIILKYRLKDLLEPHVDERYYLSDKMIDLIEYGTYYTWTDKQGNINTQCNRACDENGLSLTLPTHNGTTKVLIKGNTKKWYIPEIFNPYTCSEIKNVTPTQTTQCGSINSSAAVLISDKKSNVFPCYKDGKQLTETIQNNEFEKGEPLNLDLYNRATYEHSQTISNPIHNSQRLFDGIRIRELTPKEWFRLMGVKDEDFVNVEVNQSQTSLYHLAGDSIVTTVLMGILGELLDIDYVSKIEELIEEIKEQD